MTRVERLRVNVSGQDLYEITGAVREAVSRLADGDGLCTVYLQHTSASLTIQENADPDVVRDLRAWLGRLVPENDPLYTHTAEGPDDMPAHIKAALTGASLSIPIIAGELALGTWQGLFLWEHRHLPGTRSLLVVVSQ